MSFLGPFEALKPFFEPFIGDGRGLPSAPVAPPRPGWKRPGVSTWEKENSVKINSISFRFVRTNG